MVNCVDNINYVELENSQYRNTTVDLNMALYNQVTESQLTLKWTKEIRQTEWNSMVRFGKNSNI